MREQIQQHRQKYGIVWLAATASALVAFGGNTFAVYKAWDSKADKVFVQQTVTAAENRLDGKVNKILAYQIRAELMQLYEQKCRSQSNGFDRTINRLEDEYRLYSGGMEFRRPDCDEFRS